MRVAESAFRNGQLGNSKLFPIKKLLMAMENSESSSIIIKCDNFFSEKLINVQALKGFLIFQNVISKTT